MYILRQYVTSLSLGLYDMCYIEEKRYSKQVSYLKTKASFSKIN